MQRRDSSPGVGVKVFAAGCLETPNYFARPYHAWERGANENINGLPRRKDRRKNPDLHARRRQVTAVNTTDPGPAVASEQAVL